MTGTALMKVIGAISGTSMDGIDVALIESNGTDEVRPGPGRTYRYGDALRAALQRVVDDPAVAEHEPLHELEREVTEAHAGAIASFMREHELTKQSVALIGLHGQTILHRPQRRITRQLGSGASVARLLGIDTVDQFRHADLADGGEGAPFAPLYHQALASKLEQPLMVLNLGGVGNVTYLDGKTVIAFDTGPASALLDDFVRRRNGKPYDEDGRLAASGRADPALLAALMQHPFFDQSPPKSLDRNDFHARAKIVDGLSDADGAATLAAFTIASVADALRHLPSAPRRWLVTGGGRLNGNFMDLLAARLGVPVEPVEAVGWNGDFLEAQCFAYLALRSLRGLPLSLPSTTGVSRPITGGRLWRAPHE